MNSRRHSRTEKIATSYLQPEMNHEEMLEYISEIDPDKDEHEIKLLIGDADSKFVLKKLNVSGVIKSNEGQGLIEGDIGDEGQYERIEEYKSLKTSPPPIVINYHGEIIDGFHRIRMLSDLGINEVLAYVEELK